MIIAFYCFLYLLIGAVNTIFFMAILDHDESGIDKNPALSVSVLIWPIILFLFILGCFGALAKFTSNKISGRK